MTDIQNVVADLTTDGDEVAGMVAGIHDSAWALPTPAPGWTIAHQMAHLAATFAMAASAAGRPDEFSKMTMKLSGDFKANVDAALAEYLSDPPATLLVRWRANLAEAITALAAVPTGQLVPWLVSPIPAPVLASAGMMELFAHGQDIADALGVHRVPTDRIGHLVAFGVRTMEFGYLARDRTKPAEEFRFELTAPSGTRWDFGPADAAQRITGPAADFCLLVSRRRHRDDLALVAQGNEADEWLDLAQAYRGPAGAGRVAGQFATVPLATVPVAS